MIAHPQLEVLWSVVEPVAVLVMDRLMRAEWAAEYPLHDKPVFQVVLSLDPQALVPAEVDVPFSRFRDL